MRVFVYKDGEEYNQLLEVIKKQDGTVGYKEVLRLPVSDTEQLQKDVSQLQDWQDKQEKENPDGKVKGIKEIEEYLKGASDDDTLLTMIARLLSDKQDTISDLNTIRSNAEAGKQSSELVGDSVLIGIRAENNGSLIARYRTFKQDEEQ